MSMARIHEERGVTRICVNSSNPDSETEDTFSVSSFSSTTSSLNPSRAEHGGFLKARHAKIAAERSENGGKNYFRANPIQVLQNGDETPTDLNRSISMSNLSLAANSPSPSTAREIRSITNNYQKLLNKATHEIRKLSSEKHDLELEMEKLLEANVELATESKKLLESNRDWRAERVGLMKANQEFVDEVERLYREEEIWEEEKSKMAEEKKMSDHQLTEERKTWAEEKSKLEKNIAELVQSVKILSMDNDKLIQERELHEKQSSKSNQELKEEYEENLVKLQATISNLNAQVVNESEERERLEQELESLALELEKKAELAKDRTIKFEQLARRAEDLSAQLFETQMAKDQLSGDVEKMCREEKKMKVEIDQLKVEKEWLVSRGKDNKNSGAVNEEEAEKLKQELRAEKEKVLNLCTWKGQLVNKNKELQAENEKLRSRAEDLEALMNEEVQDINELIGVINNIQGSTGQIVDPSLLKKRYLK